MFDVFIIHPFTKEKETWKRSIIIKAFMNLCSIHSNMSSIFKQKFLQFFSVMIIIRYS